MILPLFSVMLSPIHLEQFSTAEFRAGLAHRLSEEPVPASSGSHVLHRYPPLQVKEVKDTLLAIGICQGAVFLHSAVSGRTTMGTGGHECTIISRDPAIRSEEFGPDSHMHTYEFLTPWLALNQQHAKKFYDLTGKPARDAFMEKLLLSHLTTLAKSLDAPLTQSVSCSAKVRFERMRIDRENVMVFFGKFRTNLVIPDNLAIGRSVSEGYGTIRQIPDAGPLRPHDAPGKSGCAAR
ncbi:MAG: CRISPR-associated endonuclease Cas6 [Methanomicrobiales archaeon]|nr:CRISPR-associated endonuclease Cas6 [Methanomicrobiales archaeon]